MPNIAEKPREYRVSPRYLAESEADATDAITPLIKAGWAATNDDLGNAYVTAPDLTARLAFLPEAEDSTLWKISAGPEPTVPQWLVTFDDRVPYEIVQDFTSALADAYAQGPGAYLGPGKPAPRRVAGGWAEPVVVQSPDQLVTRSTRPGFLSHAEEMNDTSARWVFESGPPKRHWYATASSHVPAPLLETLTTAAFDPSPVHRYLRRDQVARLPASVTATRTAPSPLEVARVRAATSRSLSVPQTATSVLAHTTSTRLRRPLGSPSPAPPADQQAGHAHAQVPPPPRGLQTAPRHHSPKEPPLSKPLLGLPLTLAEATLLRFLTEGYTIAEIAHRQGARAATVHSRAARARRKLGAGSNDHAVQLYAEQQAAASRQATEQAPLENTVSDPTALDHADSMIEKAWGRPIAELEKASVRLPVEDPLLRTAMHTRSHLAVVSNAAVVHQERLHALTRPGHVPAFYDLDRITQSASALRTAYAESNTALQAISHVIDARELALKAEGGPDASRVRAATARTSQAPRPLGLPAEQPAPPAAATAARPVANRR
ncbi:DNA-binding CsgD family transcriptional regulator [Kitasatospora sp. GP30]|uniref:DUF317 domain-containing protein n=1 Tax=Kitasatospora sp. GP30 TaxID=3035084 RepID=UPI000C710ED8|nr:DUF317 domain-containing protein [Kitasatospora sp. GP30]MDH6145517.1 DNA-binding CsgD family transcriptional regulator [Kitasatospora sp. GP30]